MKLQEQQIIRAVRRAQVKDQLRQLFEQTLDAMVDRYLEIDHQEILGNHYFSAASAECIEVYRDGHLISAVMASQAVNEGIINFIADRNGISRHCTNPQTRLKAFLLRLIGFSPASTTKTKRLKDFG